jgi:hypothetical protein
MAAAVRGEEHGTICGAMPACLLQGVPTASRDP